VDTLIGGAGNDSLTGGAGNDFFTFLAGFGQDTITDFDSNPAGGQDIIDLSAFHTAFGSITVANAGGGTLITVTAGNTITLSGVNRNTIDATDFRFV
jgi:Ca2+-binding RTX toxin-like protein